MGHGVCYPTNEEILASFSAAGVRPIEANACLRAFRREINEGRTFDGRADSRRFSEQAMRVVLLTHYGDGS